MFSLLKINCASTLVLQKPTSLLTCFACVVDVVMLLVLLMLLRLSARFRCAVSFRVACSTCVVEVVFLSVQPAPLWLSC